MNPADLLFADTRRISEYYTQLGGTKQRLKFTGKAKISANPSLQIEIKQKEETADIFFKISAIRKFVDDNSPLLFHRPLESDIEVDFVEETCAAIKVEIPARDKGQGDDRKIVLWASLGSDANSKSGTLVLVQDFNYPDARATSFRGASTFSVLSALVYNTRAEINGSIINKYLPNSEHPNTYAQFGTDDHPWSLSEFHNVKPYIYQFAINPSRLLNTWGCTTYAERPIRVFYKVREWGREAAAGWEKTTVFGYPIWIFAG